MKRLLIDRLILWKNSPYRKPLILKGIRQVGKTWLLKEFGRLYYKNVAYFNFDENIDYKDFFSSTKDINRIIPNLAMASGQPITPADTLIIFDEVQDCPEVLGSLKYFHENAPQYHIACAGSLLGITLAKSSSFPVGQVDFLTVYPMNFTEFLLALGDQNLAEYIAHLSELEPIPTIFYNQLLEKLKMYYITGGMPEVVKLWIETHTTEIIETALLNILTAYERDFAKHPSKSEYPKLSLLWQSLPSQLARENKKFLYSAVKNGARARDYEDALQWLVNAELAYKIFRLTSPHLPIAAYDDLTAFKIYMADVGLLRRQARLAPTAFSEGSRLFTEFKGALTENFVLQSLVPQLEMRPRYWSRINPAYEVDFIIQQGNDIIPIEVKSDINVKSRSLQKYQEAFPNATKLRVKLSLNNLRLDNDVLNIPLFLAGETSRLINLALSSIY